MRTLFEIAKSGLYASERSLSVTANNIANADTPGYSRQRVEKSAIGQQMPGYFAGLGVNVERIERLRDDMTDKQLINKRQEMGFMQEKIRIYEMLESSLASDTGADLDMRIGSFFDAFSELSNDPQDHSVRFNLVTEAAMLTEKLGDMSLNLDRIKNLTKDSTTTLISQINDNLRDISALNKSITTSKALGRPDHASMDLQVKKIEELSQLVDIDTQEAKNGATEIFINGIQVVYGDQYRDITPSVNESLGTYEMYLGNGIQVQPQG
ncbi:flagellar hook-associated protein FlgK, partial [Balneolaceae bacterium ANBcel3]|nr:flagellar hook-associated protein FlgK [Balneolaceae bacterium ANBcel3]